MSAVGEIISGVPIGAPWRPITCVGYAFELHADEQVMLREGRTAGFDLRREDGGILRIPAGAIRFWGSLPRDAIDRETLHRSLAEVTGFSASRPNTSRREESLFPHDGARGVTLTIGDRLELLAVESASVDGLGEYRDEIEVASSEIVFRLRPLD